MFQNDFSLGAPHFSAPDHADRGGSLGRKLMTPTGDRRMSGWLEGRVALVTGGASGIGRAVVERFLAEGARVVSLDLAAGAFEDLPAARRERLHALTGDVRRFADGEAAVAAALERWGRLDAFVGNAGVFDCFAGLRAMSGEVLDAAFDQIFAVNVKGALLGARAALPALEESGGSIIFTLSNAALYPDGGGPLYTASKHALVGVVRQLAHELAPRVRVNGVAPGGTTSLVGGVPALREICDKRPVGDARDAHIARRTPLGFAQEPRDHAGVYVLLASDQARAMTGVVIPSDGGVGVRGMASK
jgi:cis-3,4-dihydrophenanthrene-3,4-diol dehydrogenase